MTDLEALAQCYPHEKEHASIVLPQLQHRLNLAKAWGIAPGNTVVDIGCGQGDSVVGLAAVVGPTGRVVGIDPGPPDYGSPLTLAQAQAFIRNSELGDRIEFVHADAPTYLRTSPAFDAATLCHSLWYFDSAVEVSALFIALATAPHPPKRVCIAEWTGSARTAAQKPHDLAVRAQRMLHIAKPGVENSANVRSALLPEQILELAVMDGFRVVSQGTIAAPDGMLDCSWEVGTALSSEFAEDVRGLANPERDEILALLDELKSAKAELTAAGGKVQSMDVAWAVLELP